MPAGATCSQSSIFFFSSRRRHTRCLSDWSSDVCSSDLNTYAAKGGPTLATLGGLAELGPAPVGRALGLLRATFGEPGAWIAPLLFLALGWLAGRGRLRRRSEERRVGKECRCRRTQCR